MFQILGGLLVVSVAVSARYSDVCAISWGNGRIDAFGSAPDNSVWHKFYPGGGANSWEPQPGFEDMHGDVRDYGIAATSWEEGRLDYFVTGSDNAIWHKYWDGEDWKPKHYGRLGGDFRSGPAVTNWGKGRIDVVGKGSDNGYWHSYLNDNNWSKWAEFGGQFASKPSTVAWGPNRLDIIGISTEGKLAHKYWSGSEWVPGGAAWEDLGDGPFIGDPLITSSHVGRFDIWAVAESGALHHRSWNGIFYSEWQDLGGNFTQTPRVIHVSPHFTQVIGQFHGDDHQYQAKFHDGYTWYPSKKGWDGKGGDFKGQPAIVSTRPNEFNILGVGNDGELHLQFWTGYDFQPGAKEYYSLGDVEKPYKSSSWWESMRTQPPELRKRNRV